MKNNRKAIIVALATTALLTAGVERAASEQTPAQQKSMPQQTSASKYFGKLSADGSKAFQDLTLARVASRGLHIRTEQSSLPALQETLELS